MMLEQHYLYRIHDRKSNQKHNNVLIVTRNELSAHYKRNCILYISLITVTVSRNECILRNHYNTIKYYYRSLYLLYRLLNRLFNSQTQYTIADITNINIYKRKSPLFVPFAFIFSKPYSYHPTDHPVSVGSRYAASKTNKFASIVPRSNNFGIAAREALAFYAA